MRGGAVRVEGARGEAALDALEAIVDPCLEAAGHDLSIVDLGLVGLVRDEMGSLRIEVTFTEPGCMFTHRVIATMYDRLSEVGLTPVEIVPVWMPPWSPDRMSERAAAVLGNARSRYVDHFSQLAGAGRTTLPVL